MWPNILSYGMENIIRIWITFLYALTPSCQQNRNPDYRPERPIRSMRQDAKSKTPAQSRRHEPAGAGAVLLRA